MTTNNASDARPVGDAGLQALAGLRVLELGQLIAGPFAGKTLADFGADVIKVEPAGVGDPLRKWRMLREGTSVWWEAQSRNKRSICLDLRAAEGQEQVRALAREADVLIENFKPGTLEKWGLGWDELHALNPRLVMLRISGYGQTGPYCAEARLRRARRGHGRPAPPDGRARSHPGTRRRLDRRHAGGAARRHRRAARTAASRPERRRRAMHRRGAVRKRLQRHGKPAAGVRRLRRRPRTAPAAPCPASRRPMPTSAATAVMCSLPATATASSGA